MKRFLFTVFILFVRFSLANSLSISTTPSVITINDEFEVKFKIQTTSDEKPEISFDPINVEVLSQPSVSVSIQTSILNGVSSIKREKIYSYNMSAKKTGLAILKNIRVKIGGQIIQHRDLPLKIHSEKRELRDIFLTAEVSKKEVYLGEGIDVRYYLYTKVPVME